MKKYTLACLVFFASSTLFAASINYGAPRETAASSTRTFTGQVTFEGHVDVSTSITVTGTALLEGTVDMSNTVTISGAVTVSNDAEFTDSVIVSTDITVSGPATFTSSSTFSNPVVLTDSVDMTAEVTITGSVTVTSSATFSDPGFSVGGSTITVVTGVVTIPSFIVGSRTAAQLQADTPTAVGQLVYNSTVDELFFSTGTTTGAFAASDDYTQGP